MSAAKAIDFWFAIGSTYTYLAISRIDAIEAATGVTFRWRPFNIRQVLIEHNNTPYPNDSDKSAYMWRDIARWAGLFGLSPRLPAPYPIPNSPLANQVAILAAQEGWVKEYTKATYRLWFEQGQFCGEDPNLSASIEQAGHDPERVVSAAHSDAIIAALRGATEEAMNLGVFGAPTFVIGKELFWGNDRMEDAVSWALRGTLASRQVDRIGSD